MALSQPSPLLNLPADVLSEILENTDYKTLQSFGKTCKAARMFRPFVNIDHDLIDITFDENQGTILYGEEGALNVVKYNQQEGGCSVEKDGNEIILQNEDTMQLAYTDLECLLENQKLKLRRLAMNFFGVRTDQNIDFYILHVNT